MIKKIEEKEVEAVMDLWLKSTIEAHKFIEKEFFKSHYNTVKDVYLPNSDTYVYKEKNEVVAFISIIESNFIGALFVSVDKQGQGIGSELLNYIIKKYKSLTLAVYIENEQAVKFYKKLGFKIKSEQINTESEKIEYIMSI